MVAVVDRADAEEQHAGDDAVGHHAEDRGLDPDRGERGDAEHHEAHVPDRRERDQPFQVLLRQTGERGVDDRDHGEHADPRRVRCAPSGRIGIAIRMNPYVPIFSMTPASSTDPIVGRLGVRVGQPRVERPHRHLDREAERDRAEHHQLERRG